MCGNVDRFFAWAVAENVNPIGRREDIDFAKFLAKERIQQRGFAGFDLADDDEKQRLADVREQVLEGVEHGRLAAAYRPSA